MCGRGIAGQLFKEQLNPDELLEYYNALGANGYTPPRKSWNVAPTHKVNVVTTTGDDVVLQDVHWGTKVESSSGERFAINAKMENLDRFAPWREAQKCGVVFNGFYEWETHSNGKKSPYAIYRADHEPLVMAGLWSLDGVVVVTTPPPSGFDLHHRFPAMGSVDDVLGWADGADLPQVMDSGDYSWHRVSNDVGSVKNNHAGLVEPVKGLFDF